MSELLPDDLRSERANVSVLKVDLAQLRERDRCRLVIVLEGKDDLPVYETWIKRIDESFRWEPLVAKGKGKSLAFRKLLERDKTGLGVCTFFIVDHDYDGLRGEAAGDDIYVLPAYSIENYLVHESVLDSFLRSDLRLVGDPGLRETLIAHYREARTRFFEVIGPASERLYGARQEKCGNVVVRDVGSAIVIKDGVFEVDGGKWIGRLVETEIPVTAEGLLKGSEFMRTHEHNIWIRGKFILDFFKTFCELIYKDRVSDSPTFFSESANDATLSTAALDIRNLAARSPLPDGLAGVLADWQQQCERDCAA